MNKVQGRVTILRAGLHKGHKVIIRMIGVDYFEYITEYNGEIYSSYIIITPAENKKKLNKRQIEDARDLIFSGAEATLDTLMGDIEENKEAEKILEMVEGKKDAKE